MLIMGRRTPSRSRRTRPKSSAKLMDARLKAEGEAEERHKRARAVINYANRVLDDLENSPNDDYPPTTHLGDKPSSLRAEKHSEYMSAQQALHEEDDI